MVGTRWPARPAQAGEHGGGGPEREHRPASVAAHKRPAMAAAEEIARAIHLMIAARRAGLADENALNTTIAKTKRARPPTNQTTR